MKVNFDGSTLKVNDSLSISEDDDGDLNVEFMDSPTSVSLISNSDLNESYSTKNEPLYDDTYYANGNNGMTLEQSAYKAYDKVCYETWGEFNVGQIGSYSELYSNIRQIVKDSGRQEVYRITGLIKSLYKQGYYKGIPLSLVLTLYLEDKISYPDELKDNLWNSPKKFVLDAN